MKTTHWILLAVMFLTGLSGATDIFTPPFGGLESLQSALLIEGRIEMVKRTHSNVVYANAVIGVGGQRGPPDTLVKEIYEAKDGKIVLSKIIRGLVIPQTTTPESIQWEEVK